MKRNFATITLLFFMTASFSLVSAQAVRNAAEKGQDRNQIRNDQATIQRDKGEIAQFRGYTKGFKQAINAGNIQLAKGHQMKLVVAMEREVKQGNAKVNQSAREVGQSRNEVRNETKEIRKDKAQGRPVAAAGDRADRRDDVRDLRDDKGDLAERKARVQRQNTIATNFKGLVINTGSLGAIKAKLHLLDEFEQTMVRDMGENYEELREDKGELREDRRETREDRNNR